MKWFFAYLVRVLIAFDVLVNVIFLGNLDETISARWARHNYLGGPLISHIGSVVLTWLEPHHGSEAIEHDRERAEYVEEVEAKIEDRT